MHGLEPRCLKAQQTNWGWENSRARVEYVQRSQRQNKTHLSAAYLLHSAAKSLGCCFFFCRAAQCLRVAPPHPPPMSSSTVVTKCPGSNVPSSHPPAHSGTHASNGALCTCAQGSFPGICTCTRERSPTQANTRGTLNLGCDGGEVPFLAR